MADSRTESSAASDARTAAVPTEIRAHIWVAWCALASVPLLTTWADPDLGGHLRYGLDILRDLDLPLRDPYSFTQDRPWVNHEWLSEAIMAAVYSLAGTSGLILLKAALTAVTLATLQRQFRRASPFVGAMALTLALLCALSIVFTIRPQLWSMAALAALVPLLNRPEPPTVPRLTACAVLFAAWANLHGGWIVGAGVVGVYSATRAWRCADERGRWLLLATAAIGATLINPYGIHLWTLLADTVRPSRPEITEWQPLGARTSWMHWLPATALATIWIGLAARRRTRPPLEVSATLLLLIVASIRALRIGPLIAPAALALLAPYILRLVGHAGQVFVPGPAAARVMWVPVAVVIAAAGQSALASAPCIEMKGRWVPDLQAAAALQGAAGRMWTTFSWGQFANWKFGPTLQVSIDGRLEVYSDAVRQRHRDFEHGDERARQAFLRLDPDIVWLPARFTSVKGWLAAHGYRIDHDTGASFIAVKNSLAALPKDREALPPCFQ